MNFLAIRHPTAIALCLLGGAAVFAPTASAAAIETYPNFFSSDQIKQFESVNFDGEVGVVKELNKAFGAGASVCWMGLSSPSTGCSYEKVERSYGTAALDPALADRIHDVTGIQVAAEEQTQHGRSISVINITGTTPRHIDRHWNSGDPVAVKVAFVFLNDNSDAKFVHGSTEIPVEAGKLVVFDGNVPHNTQVDRGTVSLAGPIDLKRLSFVWGVAPSAAPCPPCTCKSVKGPKAPKVSKSSKMPKGGGGGRYLAAAVDRRNRELTLQHMTGRINEEGSVRSFVDSLGYEVDLNPVIGEKENVLAKEDCEELMSLIDCDHSSVDESGDQIIDKYIVLSDLVAVIGKDKFNALLDLHKDVAGATVPLVTVMIRLIRGAGNDAFEYHTDESGNEHGAKISTLVVALNDNSSIKEGGEPYYQGGEPYYLREDGPVLASRTQGKAFAHSYNVLHGISPLVGDHVSLILHFNHDLKLEDAGGRKLTE